MPPQVIGPGPGNRPIAGQSQDGVNEAKSNNSPKTPSEKQQNATESSVPSSATPKEKSEKKLEKSIETSIQKSLLNEKLHAKEPKSTKPKTQEEAQKDAASLNNLQQATEQVIKSLGEGINSTARKH